MLREKLERAVESAEKREEETKAMKMEVTAARRQVMSGRSASSGV